MMRGQKIGSMYNVIKTLIEAANRSTVGQPMYLDHEWTNSTLYRQRSLGHTNLSHLVIS